MLIPTLFSLFLFPTLLQMCILKKFVVVIWALAPAPFTLLPKIFWTTVTRSCARLASQNNSGTLTVTRSCTRLLIPEKNLELEVEDRQKRAATAFFPRILDFFRHRHNTTEHKTQHNTTWCNLPPTNYTALRTGYHIYSRYIQR